MVMVAGHAVVMADSLEHILHKESDWLQSCVWNSLKPLFD